MLGPECRPLQPRASRRLSRQGRFHRSVTSTSGDKNARGPLTKAGNRWLRCAAVLAAQRIGQTREPDPRLKRIFLSVAFRYGRNPGKIAVARRLLDLIYYLLKKGQDYRAPKPRAAATA